MSPTESLSGRKARNRENGKVVTLLNGPKDLHMYYRNGKRLCRIRLNRITVGNPNGKRGYELLPE